MLRKSNDLLNNCVALTGGIATGKSTVVKMLAPSGICIVDTDAIARRIVEPGSPVLDAIIKDFGKRMLKDDGTLNRELMREEIIRDHSKRMQINAITHPEIKRIVENKIIEYNKNNDALPIIIDVPLLFEVGWDTMFRMIVLVYAPRELQIQRLMKRDSCDFSKADITVKAQMNIEEKRGMSHYIIDNSGALEETEKQTLKIFKDIKTILCKNL